jgi:hypothetical protein
MVFYEWPLLRNENFEFGDIPHHKLYALSPAVF